MLALADKGTCYLVHKYDNIVWLWPTVYLPCIITYTYCHLNVVSHLKPMPQVRFVRYKRLNFPVNYKVSKCRAKALGQLRQASPIKSLWTVSTVQRNLNNIRSYYISNISKPQYIYKHIVVYAAVSSSSSSFWSYHYGTSLWNKVQSKNSAMHNEPQKIQDKKAGKFLTSSQVQR